MTRIHSLILLLMLCLTIVSPTRGSAQTTTRLQTAAALPSAPNPNLAEPATQPDANALLHANNQIELTASTNRAQTSSSASRAVPSTDSPTDTLRLTRAQAEQIALRQNPRIRVGRLLALAQHQIYRETRAAELTNVTGYVTAVDANEGTRLGAGMINSPTLLEHAGAGVTLNQLVTDFGRTSNLASSSKLLEKAQSANALATTEDVILATDQAFYNALQAQALLNVAQQTVNTRQSVEHQVDVLAQNKLKSNLDLAFAQVNLSQAKLLQLDAQNNVASTIAALTAILGFDKEMHYELVEENTQLPAPPPDVDVLVALALKQRPDLQALNYNQQAAEKFRRAQHDQLLPTISALGVAGGTPIRPDCFGGCFSNNYYTSSWYGAIGVNMSVPIFNGFLFNAQASEAKLKANAAAESTRDLRNSVVRDVRTAWLAAGTSFQRVGVAEELAKEADLSLDLAQRRYQLGLGSIVELSQAQMQQADAAIGFVSAQYQYRLALSTLNFETGQQP
jgi:outer membrane protein